eukprot:gene10073-7196_t
MAESPSLDSVALEAYDEDINPVSNQFETKIVVLTPPHSPFRHDGIDPTPHRAAELQGNELYVYNHNSHARQSERFIQLMIVSKFLTRWKQLYLAHRYDEFCSIRRAWSTWLDSVARIQRRRTETAPSESTAIVSKQLASHLLQAPYDVKQHQLPKPPQSIRVIDSMAALSDNNHNVYSASYPSNDDLQQVGYRQPAMTANQSTAAPRGGKTPKQSTVKHYMTPLTARPRLSSITAKLFATDEPKKKVSSSITASVIKPPKQRGAATAAAAAAAAPASAASVISGKSSQASSKRTPRTTAGPSITSHIHRAPPFCAMIPSDRIVPVQGTAAAPAAVATGTSPPSSSSPPAHQHRRTSPPPRREPQALLNHPFGGSSLQPVPVFFPHHPLAHLQGAASPESALTGTTTSFFPDVDGALRAMPMTMVMVPNQALLFALSNQATSAPPTALTATTAAQTIAPADGQATAKGGDDLSVYYPSDRPGPTPIEDAAAIVETQTVSDVTVFTDATVPAPPRRSASPSLVHSEARTHQLQQAALPTSSEPPPVMESVPSRAHRRLLAKRRLLTVQDQTQRRLQLQRVNAKAADVEDAPPSSAVPSTATAAAAPEAAVPTGGGAGGGGGPRKPNPLQRALLRTARRQQYYQRSELVEQEAATRYQRYRQLHFLHALRRHVDRSTFHWQLIQRSKQYRDQYTRSEAIAQWLRVTRAKQQRRQRMLQSKVPLFVTKLLVSSTETIVAYLEVMAMRNRLQQWRQWTRRQRPARLKCVYVTRIVDEERLFQALRKWRRYRDRGDTSSAAVEEATTARHSDYDLCVVDLPLHSHDPHDDDDDDGGGDPRDDSRRGRQTPSPVVVDLSHPTPPLPPPRSSPSAARRPPAHRSPSPTFSDDDGGFDAADYDADYDRYPTPQPASPSFAATAVHEPQLQPPPLSEAEAAEAAEAALLDLRSRSRGPATAQTETLVGGNGGLAARADDARGDGAAGAAVAAPAALDA